MKIHEKYIQRCIDIAKNGLGTTAPNPMVGCVIVYNQNIIGEGFTSPYGGAHAEVNAINSVKDTSLLKKATLYVTLEPCSHYGKTPPCADAIIKYQIPKVIIGTIDTHSKVAGQGIARLRGAGCNVTVGVLEEACKKHHKRFFTFHNKQRPYIILKWAETTNGFIAPIRHYKQNEGNPKSKNRLPQQTSLPHNDAKPVWITNQYSRQLVHKWRAEEQAILVGTNTVIEDNPSLTTRDWKGKHPIRIVLDKNETLSKGFKVFDDKVKTIIIKEKTVKNICNALFEANINSVIIEGGSKTLQLFIDSGIWDEARVFTGKSFFKEGVKAPKLKGTLIAEEQILDDILKTYVNN